MSCLIRLFEKISLYTRYDFESLENGDLIQRKMEATMELLYGMGELPISYPIAIARLQITPGFTWVLGT